MQMVYIIEGKKN